MLLSVIVYNHKLTPGQWLGTGVVFAGISVEAWVKRRGRGCPSYHDRYEVLTKYIRYRCTRQAGDPGEGEGTHKDTLRA